MKPYRALHSQRGATLIVGLIMMTLFTLMVTSAFNLSTSSLQSVANMQLRDDGIATANTVIEQIIVSNFTSEPTAQEINIDTNYDDIDDYLVSVAQPQCIRATQASVAAGSSVSLGSAMSTSATWNTVWTLDATVTDSLSGAEVTVRSATRVLLDEKIKNLKCV